MRNIEFNFNEEGYGIQRAQLAILADSLARYVAMTTKKESVEAVCDMLKSMISEYRAYIKELEVLDDLHE